MSAEDGLRSRPDSCIGTKPARRSIACSHSVTSPTNGWSCRSNRFKGYRGVVQLRTLVPFVDARSVSSREHSAAATRLDTNLAACPSCRFLSRRPWRPHVLPGHGLCASTCSPPSTTATSSTDPTSGQHDLARRDCAPWRGLDRRRSATQTFRSSTRTSTSSPPSMATTRHAANVRRRPVRKFLTGHVSRARRPAKVSDRSAVGQWSPRSASSSTRWWPSNWWPSAETPSIGRLELVLVVGVVVGRLELLGRRLLDVVGVHRGLQSMPDAVPAGCASAPGRCRPSRWTRPGSRRGSGRGRGRSS